MTGCCGFHKKTLRRDYGLVEYIFPVASNHSCQDVAHKEVQGFLCVRTVLQTRGKNLGHVPMTNCLTTEAF